MSGNRTNAAHALERPMEGNTKMEGKTGCAELGKASVKCIEEHEYDRSHPDCKVHFEAYKECRKKETEAKRQMKSLFFPEAKSMGDVMDSIKESVFGKKS